MKGEIVSKNFYINPDGSIEGGWRIKCWQAMTKNFPINYDSGVVCGYKLEVERERKAIIGGLDSMCDCHPKLYSDDEIRGINLAIQLVKNRIKDSDRAPLN